MPRRTGSIQLRCAGSGKPVGGQGDPVGQCVEGSELIRRLEAGIMPLGGYKGQRGAKLPAEDIQILKQWIDAGGPESARLPRSVQRPFISESQVLATIIRDLVSAPEADRPYLRYYSLANLWNSRDVEGSKPRRLP